MRLTLGAAAALLLGGWASADVPPPPDREPPRRACTRIYQPVCGADRRTYPNACEARNARMPVAHQGACRVPHIPRAAGAKPLPR